MSQQRSIRNPTNRERFDELVELNGKIQELKTKVYSSKFKPVGSLMNHLKEIEEQMNQLERTFNVFQYNLTNDWYQDDRQVRQVEQTPVFEMKEPEDQDFEVLMKDMFKDQNFFIKLSF